MIACYSPYYYCPHFLHLCSSGNVLRFLCDYHWTIYAKSLFSIIRVAASTPYECLVANLSYSYLYVTSSGFSPTILLMSSIYFYAPSSYVPFFPSWKCWLDINSLMIVDIDWCSTMFRNWFFPYMLRRSWFSIFIFRFMAFLYSLLYTVISFPTVYSIYCFLSPHSSSLLFRINPAYLKWLYMCEYHTITLYSGLVFILLRISIILLHLLAFLMML